MPIPGKQQLLRELRPLWIAVDEVWEQSKKDRAFERYVSADYEAVFEALCQLRGQARTFLEWGSGLGAVTIMAARLGFEAYGIEAEARLVDRAYQFADQFHAQVQFATGNFIPAGFEWSPADGDEPDRTILDDQPAYDQLDMELRDFDLVYAYPWPDEHALYRNILRRCGGENTLLMTYDGREGVEINRPPVWWDDEDR